MGNYQSKEVIVYQETIKYHLNILSCFDAGGAMQRYYQKYSADEQRYLAAVIQLPIRVKVHMSLIQNFIIKKKRNRIVSQAARKWFKRMYQYLVIMIEKAQRQRGELRLQHLTPNPIEQKYFDCIDKLKSSSILVPDAYFIVEIVVKHQREVVLDNLIPQTQRNLL